MTLHPDGSVSSPEPFTIGDPGKAYGQTKWAAPDVESMPSDTECDGFAVDGWSIRAASVRGLMHRQFAEPRQDAYVVRWSPELDWLVVVVCDGVSSLRLSHRAARAAADSLADEVLSAGARDDIDWASIFDVVSTRVIDEARAAGSAEVRSASEARETMATTATVLVVVGLKGPGPWYGMSASVGDTTTWIASSDPTSAFGPWSEVNGIEIDGGTLTRNSTSALPLTNPNVIRAAPIVVNPRQLLIVTTDGVSDAFVGGRGQVAIELGREWSEPPSPINFAAQVGYGRRTHTDDRTCVALWSPE